MSQLPLSQVGKMHLHLWLITFHSSTFKKLAVNPLENYVHLPWMLTPVGLTEILVSTAFFYLFNSYKLLQLLSCGIFILLTYLGVVPSAPSKVEYYTNQQTTYGEKSLNLCTHISLPKRK